MNSGQASTSICGRMEKDCQRHIRFWIAKDGKFGVRVRRTKAAQKANNVNAHPQF